MGLKLGTTATTTTGFVLCSETGKEKNFCKIKAEVSVYMCRAKSQNRDIRDQTWLKDAGVLTHSDKRILVNTPSSHLRTHKAHTIEDLEWDLVFTNTDAAKETKIW